MGCGGEGVRGVRIWDREAVLVLRRMTGRWPPDGNKQMRKKDPREADM